MPTYAYKCPACGFTRDIIKRVADLNRMEQCLHCSAWMDRQLSAPAVCGDYAPYDCPITGKRIEGRRAHEENLARHGCRVFESGERENFMQRKRSEENALEEAISDSAARQVASMTSAQQEQLATELHHGAVIETVRLSPTTN